VASIGHRARVRPLEKTMARVHVRPVYPLDDLAADFSVPLALIRREIKEGRLPAFHVGRLLRVAGEDAIEWRDRYRDAAADGAAVVARARPLAEEPGS
jgi:hypothetical protein